MSWLSGLFGKRTESGNPESTLLRLRTARFRQLLANQGALLALIEDSAEKQGGGFVFDKQYVIALAEQASELADAVAFDLNVLTSQRHLAFYDEAERLRARLRGLLSGRLEGVTGRRSESRPPPAVTPTVSPLQLAAALERSEVLYRARGTVACRGVAAGPVCNLGDRPELAAVSPGSVLVAADLGAAESVLATVRRAGALLLDRGTSAGPAARLARELRVPAILALEDATAQLSTGTEVTVDADENVVYLGRVAELLEYARSLRASVEEEEEYQLLRAVRRAAFPLTLASGPPDPALSDCRTVHDLVHLAQALAGDALCDLLMGEHGRAGVLVRLAGAPWCEARLVALDGLPRRNAGAIGPLDVASRPLRAFLDGLTGPAETDGDPAAALPRAEIRAAATDEHALAVTVSPHGADLIDATVVGVAESNRIYCRFAARGASDPGGRRGQVAMGVLSRLGFTVSLTARGSTGWVRGLPPADTEERLRILGSLSLHLARLGAGAWEAVAVETSVEEFMHGCA